MFLFAPEEQYVLFAPQEQYVYSAARPNPISLRVRSDMSSGVTRNIALRWSADTYWC
jgi:hypothetical protein